MKTESVYGFYPIVPDAEWVARLVSWGVRTVQLRAKDLPNDEAIIEIEKAMEAVANRDVQLIINDYWEEAISLGCDYIHLGQDDLTSANLDAVKDAGIKLGVSTHTRDELDIALRADPDYVALGPVYETTLKVMPYAPQTLNGVREWKTKTDLPLVAIGGITCERAPHVLEAGADSVAVVSDVVLNDNPKERVTSWLRLFENR